MPKDILFATGIYTPPSDTATLKACRPKVEGDIDEIAKAIELMANARRPVIYTGGGVVNSGIEASRLLREFVELTDFPITSTLMGLGAYPASGRNWLKMVGLHGSYEANMAMHECDVMLCIGARFDDRVTSRVEAFSPNSRKIHVDIDPSSINKTVRVDIGIQGDAGHVLGSLVRSWRALPRNRDKGRLDEWWKKIAHWRERNSFAYEMSNEVIMPQYAVERLYSLTKDRDTYITTEVGQH